MQYIESAKEEPGEGCVFCALFADPTGEDRLLASTDLAFVTLAKFPYNPGHLLVLPVRHVADLADLTDDENVEITRLMRRGLAALRVETDPHGFNVGLNLGRVAGAGIPEHLHWHVVPRWGGDTNFMPVTAQTRVLPELLKETYERLKPRFDET